MPVISKFTVGGHEVTKYNNQRLRQFEINGEVCPFAKVAQSLNGILSDPISYRIHRLQAAGNSSQATGSVPKYICQGASSVLNIASFIVSDIFAVPISQDGLTATFSQSNGTFIVTGTSTSGGNILLHSKITLVNGHKYLVPAYMDATTGTPNYFKWGHSWIRNIPAANFYWPDQSSSRSWAIITGDGVEDYCQFTFMNNLNTELSGWEPAGCFNLIDLTELYGAGNEPANPETVFQDYPEIPVGNDSWIKNDVIRSISSITLGGDTVSVDLRSAGSVYDEWASNGHGTRKVKHIKASDLTWQYNNTYLFWKADASGVKNGAQMTASNYTFNNVDPNQLSDGECCAKWGWYGSSPVIFVKNGSNTDPPVGEFEVELTTPTAISTTPLTLASGLTPTDQDGNAVTFTETNEATPSPNYPVPIVNSSSIAITDGQDTNSASIDLAGLTDKDEYFVNVKSTNIWDEVYETGGLYASDGADWSTSDRIRSKNYISVQGGSDYYFQIPSAYQIIVCWYDSEKTFISTTNYGYASAITAPANAAFCRFATSGSYGTTYKNDISISLGSTATPYMPHNTKGKVWYKTGVGALNIGNYTWNKSGNVFYRVFNEKHAGEYAMLCPKYKYKGNCGFNPPNYGFGDSASSSYLQQIFIKDEDYPDAASFKAGNAGVYIYFNLKEPTWTDITSTPTGQALLSLETYEGDSNTATVNNGGTVEMVEYFQPI